MTRYSSMNGCNLGPVCFNGCLPYPSGNRSPDPRYGWGGGRGNLSRSHDSPCIRRSQRREITHGLNLWASGSDMPWTQKMSAGQFIGVPEQHIEPQLIDIHLQGRLASLALQLFSLNQILSSIPSFRSRASYSRRCCRHGGR